MSRLAVLPEFRAEVEAAYDAGVPWRRFNGWEPASVTTFTRDDEGRVIASSTSVEPEWDESDRALFTAFGQYRASLCGGCGHPLFETTAIEAYDIYEPDGYVQCYRCTALEQNVDEVENAVKANPKAHPRRATYRYEIKTRPRRPHQH